MTFLLHLTNGLQLGTIYALIALGYSMVYGIVKLINFAHGDIIMVGAYAAVITLAANLPFWAAIIASVVVCVVFGVTIEFAAYRPLRKKNAPRISLLITAIGMSLLLQHGVAFFMSSNPRSIDWNIQFPIVPFGQSTFNLGSLVTVGASLGIMILLFLLVNKTKMGRAMRAVSEDAGASQLMGINVSKTITLTFAVGSALAGISAFFYTLAYPRVDPYMGSMLGLKAFVAAVLGGIGSIPGAMLGGLLLGVIEAMVKGYWNSTIADAFVFGILIIILLVKPSGILGKNEREKV